MCCVAPLSCVARKCAGKLMTLTSCARSSTDAYFVAAAMLQCELAGGQAVCIRIADDAGVHIAQWQSKEVRRTSNHVIMLHRFWHSPSYGLSILVVPA